MTIGLSYFEQLLFTNMTEGGKWFISNQYERGSCCYAYNQLIIATGCCCCYAYNQSATTDGSCCHTYDSLVIAAANKSLSNRIVARSKGQSMLLSETRNIITAEIPTDW